MKDKITKSLSHSTTLKEVKDSLLKILEEVQQENKQKRVGYVSGIIFSDGPLHVKRNVKILSDYTVFLRKNNSFPIFSPTDIFYDGLYHNLKEASFPEEARRILFMTFWRDILSSGFITDIFMTPRWQQSEGATDEHNLAQKQGLTIHYVQ